MARIFVVEDDETINKTICMNLSVAGYDPVPAYDGLEALAILDSGKHFDLTLLDIMLPGMDGLSLYEPLHKRGIPVIYLTAKNDLGTKLRGLQAGAEDYIVKPFEILELLVRIEKVLSRYGALSNHMQIGNIDIHIAERTVYKELQAIPMKPLEFDLLVLLARNQNVALSREKLLKELWGVDYIGETRTVDVHIAQLRKKTGLAIVSVPKIGYRLETIT
ncbi:response regulator transcription factor [Eubacteriales bacterium OttesenSCG-928-K08]|nr:response regulator transcription factor [Eubacteriales bacterium OttesenSCG-928-K08]